VEALGDHVVEAGVVATGRNTDTVAAALGEHDDLLIQRLDVTDAGEARATVDAAVRRFGGIDVLVNNAVNFYAGFLRGAHPRAVRRPAADRPDRPAERDPRRSGAGAQAALRARHQLSSLAGLVGWVAGADAVHAVEQKLATLRQQLEADRELSTNLAHEDAPAAA
jgi:NAD(P)-dependent dehydrogenase (short-subunit alcohol dehydrogenase family)